jgi:pimeloyl-ACP methyl ester carboxylesterase
VRDPNHEPWRASLRRGTAVSEDGTEIAYQVVGDGDRTLLLANGLGGRLYAWSPLLDACWRDYRLITWDYRGLFDSGTPRVPRLLSVANHVEDAIAILRAERADKAGLVGWSMGVQVSLDVAATHPGLVSGLVLLNGTYGHTLSSGFQPLLDLPYVPKRLHTVIEIVRSRPALLDRIAVLARLGELPTLALFTLTSGRRAFTLRPMLRRYMDDVLGDSFDNFMRLFQELDAHSVYHLLPEIDAPALVISGALDILTPPRQSREIARRMPHAKQLALKRASHFCLLERPEIVLPAIDRFLDADARW